jgi:Mrp family chromosome partitioning ATPase
MTASAHIVRPILSMASSAESAAVHAGPVDIRVPEWDPKRFGEEQIRGLVRRVFLPGWPRPARQVVFSAADGDSDVAAVCCRTAQMLASEGAERVCLVETSFSDRVLERRYGGTSIGGDVIFEAAGAVRASSRQIENGVWLVPAVGFLGSPENAHNPALLRSRLGQLRREFEYAVIHAGPVGDSESAALLAHLADGLVLAVEAHRTRRLTAIRVREHLLATNVRLLGVVLQDRTFPIPEGLYRRL